MTAIIDSDCVHLCTIEDNDQQCRNIFSICIGNQSEVRYMLWQFITLLFRMMGNFDSQGYNSKHLFEKSRCSKPCLEQSHRTPES